MVVLSVTTAESRSGQQDTYIHLRGVNSHEHLWIPYPQGSSAAGHRLKAHGEHATSAASVVLGIPFARASVEWSSPAGQPIVALASLNDASATTTNVEHLVPGRGQRAEVRVRDEAAPVVTLELALVQREPKTSDGFARLEWNPEVPWMLGWRLA
jgi:hypothetical protein